MKRKMLASGILVILFITSLCISACSGPKKGRYDHCPTFSHSQPETGHVMKKNG